MKTKTNKTKINLVSSTYDIDWFTFVLHTDVENKVRTSILPNNHYNKMHFEKSSSDVIERFNNALSTYVEKILKPKLKENDLKAS